jgi:glycosyltransferase involved in cell wall biosynthesis
MAIMEKTNKIKKIFNGFRYFWRLHQSFKSAAVDFQPDIVHANDLDTLLAGYLIKRKTGAKLLYDAHEIWTEQSVTMPKTLSFVAKILEKWLLGKIDGFITVNSSLCQKIEELHHIKIKVPSTIIHNYPEEALALKRNPWPKEIKGKKIILYQGRYAPDRGLEELVLAAEYLDKNNMVVLRGTGSDVIKKKLEQIVQKANLAKKVIFLPPVQMQEMVNSAKGADLGIIFYRPTNLNNLYASPNKLYEYTLAGLALGVSDLPELKSFVKQNNNGLVFKSLNPKKIAGQINELLKDHKKLHELKTNSRQCAANFSWQSEEKILVETYKKLINKERSENN